MRLSILAARLWGGGTLPALGMVSIRLRIALLVALALVGAASFAVIYALAAHRTDAALTAQDGFRRLNDLAAEAEARALALQVEAEQFLRERDPRFADAFRSDAARLSQALAAMAEVPQALPQYGRVTDLRDGFGALAGQFGRLEEEAHRLGLSEDDGLRGALGASVRAIEDELRMWPNAAPLMTAMLQMRQAEKDFTLTRDQTYVASHVRFAAQFDLGLDATTLARSTRQEFRRLLADYTRDIKAFAEGTAAFDAGVGDLRALQAALRPAIEHLVAFAHAGAAGAIAEQEAVRAEALAEIKVTGLVCVLSFVLAGTLIAFSIVAPLRRIEQAMDALAAGDHSVDIPGAERLDEIGDMAKAVAVFKRDAAEMARMQAEREQVRREAEAASRERVLSLASRFEDQVQSVAEVVSAKAVSIHRNAGGIAGGGDGRNAWSLAVAEAAEQARRTVAAVTEAAAELSDAVGEISAHGSEVGAVMGTAMAEMQAAEERVRSLSEMAARIDRIVALIGDVAQRTNMLSLNATIEATRAGEAGKGFAVVATEVKRLALQTSDSAREIAGQIAAIQAATGETVAAIAGIGAAVRRMDGLARVVNASVARQQQVTRTIERCVADVTAETNTLTDGVTAFTHTAAQQCGAAAQVLWAAEDLAAPTSTLKHEVARFLSTVRADATAA